MNDLESENERMNELEAYVDPNKYLQYQNIF